MNIKNVLLTLIALVGLACGDSSGVTICETVCGCSACSDFEFTQCINAQEELALGAVELGCGEVAAAYTACEVETLVCRGDTLYDSCVRQERALDNCIFQ